MNIRNKYTGKQELNVVHGDYADWNGEVAWCPRCDADVGQQCSTDDGEELGAFIHKERTSAEAHEPREET